MTEEISIKIWFVKIFTEFTVAAFLSFFILWTAFRLGFVETPGEKITIGNIHAPMFIALLVLFYINIRCSFPTEGIGK